MEQGEWLTVAKYAKKIGVSPQVIYNRIATGKMRKGKEWRELKLQIRRKQVYYEIN